MTVLQTYRYQQYAQLLPARRRQIAARILTRLKHEVYDMDRAEFVQTAWTVRELQRSMRAGISTEQIRRVLEQMLANGCVVVRTTPAGDRLYKLPDACHRAWQMASMAFARPGQRAEALC